MLDEQNERINKQKSLLSEEDRKSLFDEWLKWSNMSDQETITKEEVKEETDNNSPNVVIVHNDDYNTFDHVIDCLVKICKMSKEKATECSLIIHYKGKCVVAEGSDEYLKKIKLKLRWEGLTVTMENAQWQY